MIAEANRPTLIIVMNLAFAEPDTNWGQRPCEGLAPSPHICATEGTAARRARRTHPGLGAACKGSNAADLEPLSYGGQCTCWSEQRVNYYEQEESSAPAAASQATFEVAVFFYRTRDLVPHLGLGHEPLGVIPNAFGVSGGDPFTAPWGKT